MVWTSFISSRFQSLFKKLFGWIGYHAHTHPCIYLTCGLLITILSGFGLTQYDFESSGLELYVPTDSEIYKQMHKTIDLFGEFASTSATLVGDKNGYGLLSPKNLDNLWEIYYYPNFNLTSKQNGEYYNFHNLCERPYPGFPYCNSELTSLFSLFNNKPSYWQDQNDINDIIQTDDGQNILAFILGGIEYNGSRIINGSYLRMDYTLSGTSDNKIYDANLEWMKEFQDYFDDESNEFESKYNYRVSYFTGRSVEDEIERVVASDGAVYLAAIVTMFVYLSFTLGNFSCTGARPYLAIITIFVMICALITAYGIGLVLGYPLSSLAFLIPYLLLGVGVDDEIIIIEAVDKTGYFEDDESNGGERFQEALKHSGLSITLTSFCSVMAFIIGSLTTLPGVASFCVFAALGFLANYILQFLIFLPLLALDERRKRANRNFCCPCFKHNSGDVAAETLDGRLTVDDEGFSCSVTSVLKYGVLPILTKQPLRIAIILLFVATGISSIFSLPHLDTSSDVTRLVPDNSFVIDWLDEIGKAFPGEEFSEIEIILQNLDFSNNNIRSNIHELIGDYNEYNKNGARIIGKVTNWLEDFELYVESLNNDTNQTGDEILDSMDQYEFYSTLKQFENDTTTHYAEWEEEIIFDNYNNPTKIKATKFYMNFAKPDNLKDQWPMRNSLNKLINRNLGSNKGYVFEITYPYSYFEYNVVEFTIINVSWASLGVLIVLLLLMDARMAFFIIIVVIGIDFCLFGWITIIGISLDSLAFLQLVMAVGLTVDYVIHITHAIVDSKAPKGTFPTEEYNEKLRIAMLDMGVGVVKGAWTTFLGAIPLIFSQSEAFRRFAYLFFGIIIIALAHGLFLVPAVMAQIPFLWRGIEHTQDEADLAVSPHAKSERISGKNPKDNNNNNNNHKNTIDTGDTGDNDSKVILKFDESNNDKDKKEKEKETSKPNKNNNNQGTSDNETDHETDHETDPDSHGTAGDIELATKNDKMSQ